MIVLTDRSRFLKHQECPRGRYFNYEYEGKGLAPTRLSIPLATGQYAHEGLAHLLQRPDDVEGAIAAAVEGYERAVAARGLAVPASDGANAVYREQRALIEALIRAYAARQLKPLLHNYRVLEVEREDQLPMGLVRLGDHKRPLVWMSRADALLQERTTGDLYIQSFKTAASWDRRRSAENHHDVQGLSEMAAVEARLTSWAAALKDGTGEEVPAWFAELYAAHGHTPPVMGVRMEFLLKGERREDKWNPGRWVQWSPLIRGWRRPDVDPGSSGWEYAWRYEWKEEDVAYGRDAHAAAGAGLGALQGMGMRRGGRREGLDRDARPRRSAAGSRRLPRRAVRGAGALLPPAGRNRRLVRAGRGAGEPGGERWRRRCGKRRPRERGSLLNRCFPQHRRSCDWPSACPFQEICFGSEQVAADPVGSGLYVWREPHHEAEAQQLERAA